MAVDPEIAQKIMNIADLKGKKVKYQHLDGRGNPLKIYENFESLIMAKGIKIRYNKLSREIEVPVGGAALQLDEKIVCLHSLATLNNLNLPFDHVNRFVKAFAATRAYNPVADYLKTCRSLWDGKHRIEALCDTIETSGDDGLKRILMTKWLVNTVRIAFNTGKYNCEGILVIQGAQGIGKTRWIRSIVPNFDWVKTGVSIDPKDKDSVAKATKYWIVELGEMDSTLKHEQAELKQFFTEITDEYRAPYGRFSEKHPRLTCYYATVNDQEFLRDTTGNRRYWTIPATKINVDHGIDINQLWGEVMALYESGTMTCYLSELEMKVLQENNEEFEVRSPAEQKILDKLSWDTDVKDWRFYTASEVAEYIGESNPVHIGRALQKIMRKNPEIRFEKHRKRYLLPPRPFDVFRQNNPPK